MTAIAHRRRIVAVFTAAMMLTTLGYTAAFATPVGDEFATTAGDTCDVGEGEYKYDVEENVWTDDEGNEGVAAGADLTIVLDDDGEADSITVEEGWIIVCYKTGDGTFSNSTRSADGDKAISHIVIRQVAPTSVEGSSRLVLFPHKVWDGDEVDAKATFGVPTGDINNYKAPTFEFGPNGYAGWSCGTDEIIVGASWTTDGEAIAKSIPAGDGQVFPHYTFGDDEYGWVIQNGPVGQDVDLTIYCMEIDTIEVDEDVTGLPEDCRYTADITDVYLRSGRVVIEVTNTVVCDVEASVTVVKEVRGDEGATTDEFDVRVGTRDRNILITLEDGESRTFYPNAGTENFGIAEQAIAESGWTVLGIACDSNLRGVSFIRAASASVVIDEIGEGENITCTIVNRYTAPTTTTPTLATTTTTVAVLGTTVTTTPTVVLGTTVTTMPTQVLGTTVSEVSADTLPFTGFEAGSTVLLAMLAMLAGGLTLFAVGGRKQEEGAITDIGGWSNL